MFALILTEKQFHIKSSGEKKVWKDLQSLFPLLKWIIKDVGEWGELITLLMKPALYKLFLFQGLRRQKT